MVKNLLAMQENWVWSLGWEDPLEKEMVTHSNIFTWRIPWTEKPLGLQSVGSQRFRHEWVIIITTMMLTIVPINAFILSRSRPDESVGGDNLKGILVRGLPWTPKTVRWWIFDFRTMRKQYENCAQYSILNNSYMNLTEI